MPPALDVYADGLREWLKSEFPAPASHANESTEQAVANGAEVMACLNGAGWNRYGWPSACGGLGGDARYRAVLYDLVAAADVALPEHVVAVETLAPALVRFAPHLAARWLPDYLAGRELWSQGFSEPEAGSDLAALRCSAIMAENGSDLILNGQKTWTSLGHLSQRVAVLCRTGTREERHRGLTLLMVDVDSSGVDVRPIRMANGRNEFSEMFFDDVRVPRERVVGEVGDGWRVAMYLLQFERGMYAWQRQAWLLARLRRLRSSPATARYSGLLGDVYQNVLALRSRSARSVRALARGADLGSAASVDKILLAHAEQTVLDAARAIQAPALEMGSEPEADGWRADWFYTRAASIYGGAGEIQRGILADRVLDLPRETR